MDRNLTRVGPISAVGGALLLFASTLLHPLEADPNDALAAFAEYAADRLWVTTHLGQFLGIALIVAALLALSRTLDDGAAALWSRIGLVGAVASLAVAAALQAVDGVALKAMVDRWAAASGERQQVVFETAFAVRQVEIGLSSLMSLLFGLTVMVYGVATLYSHRYPPWLAWIAILGGLGTSAAGLALAYTGFSGLAMMISMPASLVLLLWMIAVGVLMWRPAAAQSS